MSLTISILVDPHDIQQFTSFVDAMARRASDRAPMVEILKAGLEPVVAAEQANLAGHDKTGALSASLVARSGSGDRPGTISAFVRPTARSKRGKHQMYGPMVHQGHIIIRRRPAKEGDKIFTDPIPFARDAMESVGETNADAVAESLMKYIYEG